ncbi:MAG: glycoside hydrolase family 127 protein [Planctomycetes bacterium]|nr:glycoside hydrolase family 127 protein [Planctomycetota bacterium]
MSLLLYRCYMFLVLVAALGITLTPPATDKEDHNTPPNGFTTLFNGRNLDGWKGLVGGPPKLAKLSEAQLKDAQQKADDNMRAHWSAVNGELVFDGKGSSLVTKRKYRDFELLLDWKIEKGGDSGIYLRGSPQIQIWDNQIGSGGLYNNQKNPSKPLIVADNTLGEWNKFRIVMIGDRVTVWLNEIMVVKKTVLENYWERDEPIYEQGPIELQAHGNPLWFRNIFVREIKDAKKEKHLLSPTTQSAEDPTDRLTAVPFVNVIFSDNFWAGRIETNRLTTIPYCLEKCEETGRLSNFTKAAGLAEGEFQGIYYNDSDVYKVIEGIAYSLAAHPDVQLESQLDELIDDIAAAQQRDGYLNTFHTLVEPDNRWTNIRRKHELYCAGHLFEAAVAHFQATGKRSLLNVAIKFADHIDSVFGPNKRHDPPGHQEIEIGLVKLSQVTGDDKYLTLAKFFLDQRGRSDNRESYGPYCQDHKPVIDQDKPVGHAVRAMYQYCGMADVAALTGDDSYINALDKIWRNEIDTKLYLTGGVGARGRGEAFGGDYELPNATAYNETCAAIGNAMFNHRMNLLHRDAKYADVVEKILYNGFLSGVSLSGDRFFYPNPLESDGNYHRSEWFGTSCCPVNVVRFVPSVAGYVYAHDGDDIYVNLYASGIAEIEDFKTSIKLVQQTNYPWDGKISITVEIESEDEFAILLRIPGWARGEVIASDLYSFVTNEQNHSQQITISVNGSAIVKPKIERGYARIKRTWTSGDVITLNLPMPVRLIRSHEKVEANTGRIAIQRGPIVYCVEEMDVDGSWERFALPHDIKLKVERRKDLLGGVTVLTGQGIDLAVDGNKPKPINFTAIPYYAWDHREPGKMLVWIPQAP